MDGFAVAFLHALKRVSDVFVSVQSTLDVYLSIILLSWDQQCFIDGGQ